jgi:hypothetical protein
VTRASAPATVKRTGGGDYQFVVATFGLTFASVHIPPLREIAEGELFLPGSEFLLAAFLILSAAPEISANPIAVSSPGSFQASPRQFSLSQTAASCVDFEDLPNNRLSGPSCIVSDRFSSIV